MNSKYTPFHHRFRPGRGYPHLSIPSVSGGGAGSGHCREDVWFPEGGEACLALRRAIRSAVIEDVLLEEDEGRTECLAVANQSPKLEKESKSSADFGRR